MKLVKKDIESWIKPFATVIGDGAPFVDPKLKETNASSYFIQRTLPTIFDSYAIALQPFTIRGELPKGTSENFLEELTKVKYTRTSWVELYKLKEATFDLDTAILDLSNGRTSFPLSNNVFFPAEGYMDETYFESFINTVIKFYGDQEIEAFYVFLATTNH
ncbi:MAG: hypothetical protein AB8B65_16150, partial [Kordia sp.]|uniref:hypothetical protein n=1 Tax=Kordia sp. TaxID=1965332 RepID=UPI0038589D20